MSCPRNIEGTAYFFFSIIRLTQHGSTKILLHISISHKRHKIIKDILYTVNTESRRRSAKPSIRYSYAKAAEHHLSPVVRNGKQRVLSATFSHLRRDKQRGGVINACDQLITNRTVKHFVIFMPFCGYKQINIITPRLTFSEANLT